VPFEVVPTGVEELTAGDPRAVAAENARRKALAVAGELVLGADTLVTLDGAILGKPRDAAEAAEYVGRLAGRTHEVVGGIALARDGAVVAEAVEVTEVTFRALDDAEVAAYVALGEWEGRAGGYAIQGRGAALVRAIAGDYLNVVGLPLARLLDLLPLRGLQQIFDIRRSATLPGPPPWDSSPI
jgi:septum formation protein